MSATKPEACPFCGCGMTVMDDGAPMHQGRKWYETERVVCLERQLANRNRDLTAANNERGDIQQALDRQATQLIETVNDRNRLECSQGGQAVNEYELRIKDLKAKLALAQKDMSLRTAELEKAEAHITRLEEAGDAMAAYEFLPDRLAENWTAAKEAKP